MHALKSWTFAQKGATNLVLSFLAAKEKGNNGQLVHRAQGNKSKIVRQRTPAKDL